MASCMLKRFLQDLCTNICDGIFRAHNKQAVLGTTFAPSSPRLGSAQEYWHSRHIILAALGSCANSSKVMDTHRVRERHRERVIRNCYGMFLAELPATRLCNPTTATCLTTHADHTLFICQAFYWAVPQPSSLVLSLCEFPKLRPHIDSSPHRSQYRRGSEALVTSVRLPPHLQPSISLESHNHSTPVLEFSYQTLG